MGLLHGCTERHAFGCVKSVWQSMAIFFSPEVAPAFSQDEVLVSFSAMPSLISFWYFV